MSGKRVPGKGLSFAQGSGDRAGDGIRTHDNDVGNVVLYQLSYTRDSKRKRIAILRRAQKRIRDPPLGRDNGL